MSDRLCLTDDRMVPCPVARLEAVLDEAHVWKYGGPRALSLAERVELLVAQRDDARGERDAGKVIARLTAEVPE